MGIILLGMVGYFAIATCALFAALGFACGVLVHSIAPGTVACIAGVIGGVSGFCFGFAGLDGNAGLGVGQE